MTDVKSPELAATKPTASTSSSHPNPPAAAVRHRIPQRASVHNLSSQSQSPRPPPLPRRRSSVLSFSSIEETRRSFADEFLNPQTVNPLSTKDEGEVTHWHSTPLAFAILPAIGGLLFQNGSAFVTDILLLGLAAIFMNWSIRLPWDWYYSAQALRRDVEPDAEASDTIVEEELQDDIAVETASSVGGSPDLSPRRSKASDSDAPNHIVVKRAEAVAILRRQEIFALLATFLFPVIAAYLLHVIRAQLSRPSTSLVSDYNLSIFLLAAEIRPVRQIVRLLANRTLHLQRIVTGIDDPFSSVIEEKSNVTNLTQRIADLEASISQHHMIPQTVSIAQKADVSELSIELRKRYEPRLEGLERAVRRYEKRSTTMALATEQRLQSLEARLQDALSLAAVAAQHSQNKGMVAYTLEVTSRLIALPIKVTWYICIWPVNALEELYARLRTVLLGPVPAKQARRKAARHDGSNDSDGRPRDKTSMRKLVR